MADLAGPLTRAETPVAMVYRDSDTPQRQWSWLAFGSWGNRQGFVGSEPKAWEKARRARERGET